MKKILTLTLLLCVTSLSAQAYVDHRFMTTEQYLKNDGYSKEMSRTINLVKVDPYSTAEDIDDRKFFERFYNYLDPAKGADSNFPCHQIRFNNSWKDY